MSLILSNDASALSDDAITNDFFYPVFSASNSGIMNSASVSSTKLKFNPLTGNLNATLFTSLSDESQKINVAPITNALDIVAKLNPVKFDWIDNNKSSIGLIAQQLELILPELVETNKLTGLKSVNYDGLIGVLIAAIQELISNKEK